MSALFSKMKKDQMDKAMNSESSPNEKKPGLLSSTGKKEKEQPLSQIEKLAPPDASNGPIRDSGVEEMILIGNIIPDQENGRTRHILPGNPSYNRLDLEHPDYEENQRVIDSIVELAEHFKTTPLQQRIAVYRYKGKYKPIYGSKRLLSMKLAFGDHYQIGCVVYDEVPKNKSIIRFVENSARSELGFTAKLMDFKLALEELISIYGEMGQRKAASKLGISRTFYAEYFKIVEKDIIFNAVIKGHVRTKETAYELSKIDDESELNDAINHIIDNGENYWNSLAKPNKASRGSYSKSKDKLKITIPSLTENKSVMQDVLSGALLKKYDWSDIDWDNTEEVQTKISDCIQDLISKNKAGHQ